MNFFENQDRARQNTQQLIGLFVLSIVAIVGAIYIATLFFLRMAPRIWWHPQLFLCVAGVTTAVIALASFYKIACLREGGSAIAIELGGRLLISDIANPNEQQLLNIVEEMAIASGISVPFVYVLDSELGINAFAAGFTPNDAAIGVTRGCLEQLNRDELQGVIGHEFSHILNGDMRLNLRLVGLLHGILFLYLTGVFILRFRSSYRSENKGLWAFGLALMLIGGVGLFCGRLIKAAVSRQREFLADASAVQFTRNTDGIAGALEKIERIGSGLYSPAAEAASHMFFGNALQLSFWEDMLATHPPLSDRIRRIRGLNYKPSGTDIQRRSYPHESAMGFALSSAFTTGAPVAPEKVVNQVGRVAPEHFTYAQKILADLPETLRLGLQRQQSAIAIVYALTLNDTNSPVRDRQLEWLREVQPAELVEETLLFVDEIASLDSGMRLPLVDLAIPALRQSSPSECQQICKCVKGLIKVGGDLSLWEFVLQLVLWHRLEPCIHPESSSKAEQFDNIQEIWSDCILVLSALAKVGQSQPDAIAYAFRSGVFRLPKVGQQEQPETPIACNFAGIQKSLNRLRLASPKLKQATIDACAHTVMVDNQVTPQEADLLRAIVITLDCPMPPFLIPRKRSQK
ncbi:M48 family metalloprotease [Scytonema sp. UIC 10036]|uniref:M48 family metallopeptidase n=1 Tax=Scytonema sp. UIC 10036 TaxID=2304196 RepID=UPI0012DA0708|nr:M48 family metallopeptidase [Scytonema sp. UIC 10036]MUG91921.1 M48 family metalloprotease [Scytonema sp. UIC 10036]